MKYTVLVTEVIKSWYVLEASSDDEAEERAAVRNEERIVPHQEETTREIEIVSKEST